jgi:hypothetical protein
MSRCFIWNKTSLDLEEIKEFGKNSKLLCLYDSKSNSLINESIPSNKINQSILQNLMMFVSGGPRSSSLTSNPIIILNNLSTQSIQLIKSDPILRAPKSFGLSVIFVGTPEEFANIYNTN